MAVEQEIKFINIDIEDMRGRLLQAGAACIAPVHTLKRYIFEAPGFDQNTWVRVRQEFDKTTMTYKSVKDASALAGVEEIELVVDDIQNARDFLCACGLEEKSYQETKREIWQGGDVTFSIDVWPCLNPFLEVESRAEGLIRDAVKFLNLDWDEGVFGAVDSVYARAGISPIKINRFPHVTFANEDEIISACFVGRDSLSL